MAMLLASLVTGLAQAADTLSASGLDELGDQALIKTMLAYYQAEKAHDWQTTYSLRGARFAAVVPYDTYARQMDIDANGWELVGIAGRSIRVDGAVTDVTVSFQEDLAQEVAARLMGPQLATPGNAGTAQHYSQPEVTQWQMEDGQWVALTPGARQHFVFNERMVWN
jgi:hypothetical protein